MRAIATLLAFLTAASAAFGQGMFAPVARVNDRVITSYELNQRVRFNRLLGAPGNLQQLSLDQLIDDRLRLQAATRLGVMPASRDVDAGMTEFAGRANLDQAQFVRIIEANGVDRTTFRDFVTAGVAWRNVVRARFGQQAERIERGQVRRLLASGAGADGGVRVLFSEIVMPARNARERAIAQARAAEIGAISTEGGFAAAAARYSVAPTASGGGRLDWLPVEALPEAIRARALTMGRNEVVGPVPLGESIGWFMLRNREDAGRAAARGNSIDYATVALPGGRGEALVAAGRIDARASNCDDLYGAVRRTGGQVTRQTQATAQIPADVAAELARLDEGEMTAGLVRGGQTILVMLCTRAPYLEGEDAPIVGSQAAMAQIRGQRLEGLADGYLQELRADARIQRF